MSCLLTVSERTVHMMIKPKNKEVISEKEIDENMKESFPASDAPSWTLGVKEEETQRKKNEAEKLKNAKKRI